jgi:nucleoside triphosphate pyrophosphatase
VSNAPILVLASASPRRQELLRNAGIGYTVHVTNISELPQPGESGRDCAERLAREKARAAVSHWPDAFVLGADTVVFVDGKILGKPRDAEDAARMLRMLSGRTHQVITGICLIAPLQTGNNQLRTDFKDNRSEKSGSEETDSETTLVTMNTLTEENIASYIANGEPMDKAGAYAIQGIASRWIPRVEGDYFNVVGLPVSLVYRMLQEQGVVR